VTRSITAEGQAGLDALARDPGAALVASDFDGTLSPIVEDPESARATPGAVEALVRLASRVGTVAIITGRPAADAVRLGGLAEVPGLIVLGHYGADRWPNGQAVPQSSPAGLEVVRGELPVVLAGAGAPEGTRIEDKGHAVAVHTRQTSDPGGVVSTLRGPLTALAERNGLVIEPGRFVLELRPPGSDKGAALTELVTERGAKSVVFCGDDLGDLAAFAAVRALRERGIPGCTVCSASPESTSVAAEADVVTDGPTGIVAFLGDLSASLGR
jgi:trehalose 6-phosphate phosphatase